MSSIGEKRKAPEEPQEGKKKRGVIDAASALAALSVVPGSEQPPSPLTDASVEPILEESEQEEEPASPTPESPVKVVVETEKTETEKTETEKVETETEKIEPKTSNRSGDFAKTFPEKLMDMLDDEENKHIISWLPHGKSFVIHDPFKLTAEVLPRYHLKRCKFESFTRKLYFWGFRKISQGKDTDAFYNKLFKRGDFPLCRHIRCRNDSETITNPTAARPTKPPVMPHFKHPDRRMSIPNAIEKELHYRRRLTLEELDSSTRPSMRGGPETCTLSLLGEKPYRTVMDDQPTLLSLMQQRPSGSVENSMSRGRSGRDLNGNGDMLRALMVHRRRHESITAAALSSLSRSSLPPAAEEPRYNNLDCLAVSDILRSALDVIGR